MITEVSAVIPHYGELAPTLELVRCLQNQQGPVEVQIIISDDCSPIPFPEGDGYEVVRRAVNGGYGSACNSGAALAKCDHILFLNSDLGLGDRFIADLLSAANPWQPAVVSPSIMEPGGLNHVPRKFPKARYYVIEWLVPLARFQPHMWWQGLIGHDVPAVLSRHAVVTDWLAGAAYMVPASDFRAVGGFDERYFMNCEETDLHLRLLKERGLTSVYLPEVRAEHAAGGSSDPAKKSGWLVDSRFRYAHKWGGEWNLRLGLLAATWINWLWNWQRQLRGVDVNANAVRREQLGCIRHGWKARGR